MVELTPHFVVQQRKVLVSNVHVTVLLKRDDHLLEVCVFHVDVEVFTDVVDDSGAVGFGPPLYDQTDESAAYLFVADFGQVLFVLF